MWKRVLRDRDGNIAGVEHVNGPAPAVDEFTIARLEAELEPLSNKLARIVWDYFKPLVRAAATGAPGRPIVVRLDSLLGPREPTDDPVHLMARANGDARLNAQLERHAGDDLDFQDAIGRVSVTFRR